MTDRLVLNNIVKDQERVRNIEEGKNKMPEFLTFYNCWSDEKVDIAISKLFQQREINVNPLDIDDPSYFQSNRFDFGYSNENPIATRARLVQRGLLKISPTNKILHSYLKESLSKAKRNIYKFRKKNEKLKLSDPLLTCSTITSPTGFTSSDSQTFLQTIRDKATTPLKSAANGSHRTLTLPSEGLQSNHRLHDLSKDDCSQGTLTSRTFTKNISNTNTQTTWKSAEREKVYDWNEFLKNKAHTNEALGKGIGKKKIKPI